jgi:hypothetical protein
LTSLKKPDHPVFHFGLFGFDSFRTGTRIKLH